MQVIVCYVHSKQYFDISNINIIFPDITNILNGKNKRYYEYFIADLYKQVL